MADRYADNPFVGFFSSPDAAERYVRLRQSGLMRIYELDPASQTRQCSNTEETTEDVTAKDELNLSDVASSAAVGENEGSRYNVKIDSLTKQVENTVKPKTENVAVIAGESSLSDEAGNLLSDNGGEIGSNVSEFDVSNVWLTGLVEEVFGITLNKSPRKKVLVFLEEVAAEVAPNVLFDLEILETALFQRLMLENVGGCLINNTDIEKSEIDSHVADTEVISYLFECYKRLCNGSGVETVLQVKIEQMKNLVLRNAATALRQPGLFEGQELHIQIINIFKDNTMSVDELVKFFNGITQEFLNDESEPIEALREAFFTTLNFVYETVSQSNLFTLNHAYLNILQTFSLTNELGSVLLMHNEPKDANIGISYANTIFGAILSLSCLPNVQNGPYEFFTNPLEAPDPVEQNIWRATSFICDYMQNIFYNLLKASPHLKHKTLLWLGNCLHSNAGRGKLWNTHSISLRSSACVSDGFMLNLGSVLLHLCQPIFSNPNDLKVWRIDPTYCAVKVTDDAEAELRGVHMKGLDSQTCLIPAIEGELRPSAEKYGFVTECFFMAHRALDLGFRVVMERLMRLNQDLVQIERIFNEAQAQANSQSEVVETIRHRMEREMTKYFSIRASLLEPSMLSLMAQFHMATAVWLVQVAIDVGDQGNRTNFAPAKMHTIMFPLPEPAPVSLSCVPEFLIENLVGFLSFSKQFNPGTLEEQGFDFLNPVLTEVLVFMGSQQRMRNPHLRAHLADCLESLLPHHSKSPVSPRTTYGNFFRERLFKEHPHREQIVRCLLEVFVGIEMTGQNVAFEQKFNYRRPMYIVMDYLWQIEEHKDWFKKLAEDAEANMEAVSPPIFLRFINLLMNDAVFLLDDALTNMAQLRQMQTARDSGEWQQLPLQEREQNESIFQHTGMIARFDNILGRETIHTLEFLTSEITSIFTHPTMVDRIAAMLNYFLCHLVGPKKKNFKVKDQKEYEFDPASIVMNICKIYVHLYESDEFCVAVSSDGRSYSRDLFPLAEDVLARIGGGALIADLQAVAAKVAEKASQQQTEEEILAEAPEEFLDPIMSTLMTDPVMLPSSRKTVDRSTIARHLLSDQTDPFNRSPLTMDMVKPDSELKKKIEEWIMEKKQQHQK